MSNKKQKHLSVRMDAVTHAKLVHIAAAERRSLNRQIIYLINKNIKEVEKEREIDLDK